MFPLLSRAGARSTPLFVLLPLLAAVSGCGRFTHTKQCRALIAQVNPALDDVLTITNGIATSAGNAGNAGNAGSPSTTGSSGYIAAAGRYERLAKQLGPMEFGTEDMAKSVAEYAGILSSAAQGLRALATALDSNNISEAERNSRDLERLVVHERSVIARMDAWCQP